MPASSRRVLDIGGCTALDNVSYFPKTACDPPARAVAGGGRGWGVGRLRCFRNEQDRASTDAGSRCRGGPTDQPPRSRFGGCFPAWSRRSWGFVCSRPLAEPHWGTPVRESVLGGGVRGLAENIDLIYEAAFVPELEHGAGQDGPEHRFRRHRSLQFAGGFDAMAGVRGHHGHDKPYPRGGLDQPEPACRAVAVRTASWLHERGRSVHRGGIQPLPHLHGPHAALRLRLRGRNRHIGAQRGQSGRSRGNASTDR